MDDEEFFKLLNEYLDPPVYPNAALSEVEVVWERNAPDFGAKHIWERHQVSEREVEEVLFEVPPYVEARRHPLHPNRTAFWGCTRFDRWIFIVCEDWSEEGIRFLKPITAFEPDEGAKYWERFH